MAKAKAKVKPRTLGDVADEHWKLELAKDELEDRIKLIKEKQGALEAEALDMASTIDSSAAKTYYGKISIGEIKHRVHPKMDNPPLVHKFIKKTGRFELLENRISSTAYFELRESGVVVPGITVFEHDVFKTRRRKGG